MSLLILSLQPAPAAAFIPPPFGDGRWGLGGGAVGGGGDKYDAFIFLHIKALSSGCFLPKWRGIVARSLARATRSEQLFSNEDITAAAAVVAAAPRLSQSQEAWTKASLSARKTAT